MLPARRSLKGASSSPLTTGEIYSHLLWKVWFWGQTKVCKAGWECPGLGGFYLWYGSSYDCAAFWGTILPLMQWNLSSLGLQVTALVALRPGRGWQAALCPSTQQRGQPGAFYGVIFRWTLLPASFTLTSPEIDLTYVLPNTGGLNSPEEILGSIINMEVKWNLKPNSFVWKKYIFPFLQNSWKHYEALPKFLQSEVHAHERIQSKDKTHLKTSPISEG